MNSLDVRWSQSSVSPSQARSKSGIIEQSVTNLLLFALQNELPLDPYHLACRRVHNQLDTILQRPECYCSIVHHSGNITSRAIQKVVDRST